MAPHEVAALPYHYFKALRDEYLIGVAREVKAHEKALAGGDEEGLNVLGEQANVDIDSQYGIKR